MEGAILHEAGPIPSRITPLRLTLPLTVLIQVAASVSNVAPSVAAPILLGALGLSNVAVGLHVALLYICAIFSAQAGPALVRRFGPVRTSQLALLSGATGLFLVSAPYLASAVAGTMLIGFCAGPITPASSNILAHTAAPARFGLVFSVKQMGVPLGGLVAALLVPPMLAVASGTAAMMAAAALCLATACGAQLLRAGLDRGRCPDISWPQLRQLAIPIRASLADHRLRPLVLASMVLCGAQVSLTSYFVTFLTHDLRWSIVAAGAAMAIAQTAGAVSRLCWGWVADTRVGARMTMRIIVILMGFMSGATGLLPVGGSPVVASIVVAVFAAAAFGWTGVFFATLARHSNPQEVASVTAGGLFFNYLGVATGPALFGTLAVVLGSHGAAFLVFALPLLALGLFLPFPDSRRSAH